MGLMSDIQAVDTQRNRAVAFMTDAVSLPLMHSAVQELST